MSNTTEIASNKYVSLTTFTGDGTPKPLPVWIVDLGDGRVGFTTSIDSWKVKRIRNDARVTLQACDSRGRVDTGSPVVSGTATVDQGDDFDTVRERLRSKYGLWVPVITFVQKVRGVFSKSSADSDAAVLVTPDAS